MKRIATLAVCALCVTVLPEPAESAGPLGLGGVVGQGANAQAQQAAAARLRLQQSAALRAQTNAAAKTAAGVGSQVGGLTNRGSAALQNRLQSRIDVRAGARANAGLNGRGNGRGNVGVGVGASANASARGNLNMFSPGDRPEGQPGRNPERREGGLLNLRSTTAAEANLRTRLAQIDRLRDIALEKGDVELLERADVMETRARAEFMQHQQLRAEFPGASPTELREQFQGSARLTGAEFGQEISSQAQQAGGLFGNVGGARFGSEFGSSTSGQARNGVFGFNQETGVQNSSQVFLGGTPPRSEPPTFPQPTVPQPKPEPAPEANAFGSGEGAAQGSFTP